MATKPSLKLERRSRAALPWIALALALFGLGYLASYRMSLPALGFALIAAVVCLLLLRLVFQNRQLTRAEAASRESMQRFQASEARLNEAQRIAQMGSWMLDLTSGELIWSDQVFRLFEMEPKQFQATYAAFLNAVHPDDRGAVDQAYTNSLITRMPYEITHRLLMSDGRIKWVHERCDSEFDAAGKPLRSVGTVQDITARKQIEDELYQAKQQMDSIVSNIPAMVFLKRASDLRFELFNRAGEELLGYAAEDLLGKNDYDMFPKEQADFFTSLDRKVLASDGAVEIPEEKITTASGETRVLTTRKVVLRGRGGEPSHLLGISIDITERKEVEEELRIAASAFESQEGLVVTDANENILRVNRAFTEISGYSAEELVGRTPRLLKSGRHGADFYREMWASIRDSGGWRGEIWDRRKNGEIYPKWLTISAVKDVNGAVTHYVGTNYDITERKQAEEKINELAFFDQLTGLPNRTLLLDRLRQVMVASARSGSHGALLFLDLDNFKTLNDTLGHDMGDLLLQQAANRLTLCMREGDTVARLGGDEFVVVLAGLSTDEGDAAAAIEVVAEKILATLNQSYQLGSLQHQSSASVGVTLFKGDQATIDDLMKQADLAMYKSKAAGRNLVHFFDPTLESAVKERAALEEDLRRAIEGHQFLLHYQPQVTTDGQLTGAEVLVRWLHPVRGMISPADFIPLAEDTGLILPLGYWVMRTACEQLVIWASHSATAHLTIAVNVSARQFRQSDFVEQVLSILSLSGANPQRLKLELTESLLVENVQDIIAKMIALKARGVGFSLDDFGTGYSSLTYLKSLPLDQLKIDQSFVRDVLTDPNDAAIARTIVALGQSLGLGVIAEGVECESQRSFLEGHGCHSYQGYLFGRPMSIASFDQFVHSPRQVL